MTPWVIAAIVLLIVLATLLVWLLIRSRRKPAAETGPAAEIAFLAKGAAQRLRESSRPAMGKLPLILLAGEAGSSKTSIALNSGLNPELLAGQDRLAETAGPPPPTACANFWLANDNVLVEAGGALLTNEGGVAALAARLRPANTASALGASAQSPRALVVCVAVDAFLQADAGTATLAAAKRVRAVVADAAQQWSTRMPLYVLFTRMDQVKYFSDFVRNLSVGEAEQVFGATLPLAGSLQPGIYNQEQPVRLAKAFEELDRSLTDSRIEVLRRENELGRTPNTYEFPREFRKLRDNLSQFLVELGRPSQLQATPFLRGFFFTGVRPVVMEGSRRVPQWVFLRGFFQEALLGDRLAFQAAATNTGAGRARNWLLGAAAAACLTWLGGATVSYFKNHELLEQSRPPASLAGGLLERLQEVDRLRVPAEAVSNHMSYRPPMSHRWGVYPGEPMQRAVRENYCRVFEGALLKESRTQLESRLEQAVSRKDGSYDSVFDDLKAYLMLTINPEKRQPVFLANHLIKGLAPNSTTLAARQFRFIGSQNAADFCVGQARPTLVASTRSRLNNWGVANETYDAIVARLNTRPPIQFLDPTGAMRNTRQVAYAFSKAGFEEVQSALGSELRDREAWVLGGQATSENVSAQRQSNTAMGKYRQAFVKTWRDFADGGEVNAYGNLQNAANKLRSISSAQSSPMLRLFCIVSDNTDVKDEEIAKTFKPYRDFVPPELCRSNSPLGDKNRAYMDSLVTLQASVETMAGTPLDQVTISGEAARAAANQAANGVFFEARQAALLSAPIIEAERIGKGAPIAAANKAGAAFCQELGVLNAFPFNPAGTRDADLDALKAALAPGQGLVFTAADRFPAFVSVAGGRFSPKDGPSNPGFATFLNQSVAISQFLFQNGQQPRVEFSVQVPRAQEAEDVELTIGNKRMRKGSRENFVWPDDTRSAQLKVGGLATARYTGDWALTRLLTEATMVGSTANFALAGTVGRSGKVQGNLRVEFEMKGAGKTLSKESLTLRCVSQVARLGN